MKINLGLIAASISIGLIAGLWMMLGLLNLEINTLFAIERLIPVSFLGWASFYAIGGKPQGFINGLLANWTGILWGVFMSALMGWLGNGYLGGFVGVGLGSALVVLQAHIKRLGFIPGAFIGAAAFFAVGLGQISLEVLIQTFLGLLIGLTLGIFSETGTNFIMKFLPKQAK